MNSPTQPQVEAPPIEGVVHVEVELINPPGKWERDQRVQYPNSNVGAKLAVMNVLMGIRQVGLITTIDDSTVEIVPESRVVKYRATLNTISLADNLSLAQVTGKITL